MDSAVVSRLKPSINIIPGEAISPSTVLSMLRIEIPRHAIKIRGEVLSLKTRQNGTNPLFVYGDIGDEYSSIEFKIKPNNRLQMRGQQIEIIGTLKTRENYQRNGILVTIEGEMSRECPIEVKQIHTIANVDERDKLSLYYFLEQYSIKQLCILSTKEAYLDFTEKCKDRYIIDNILLSICNFDSQKQVIQGIREVKNLDRIKGIVVLHDSINCWDMRIWDNPDIVSALLDTGFHFYSVLGYSDKLLLTDKHSDEAFNTPSLFSSRLLANYNKKKHQELLANRIDELENTLGKITPGISKLKKFNNWLLYGNYILAIMFIIIFYFYFYH